MDADLLHRTAQAIGEMSVALDPLRNPYAVTTNEKTVALPAAQVACWRQLIKDMMKSAGLTGDNRAGV